MYKKLSKEEKKKIREQFAKTKKGSELLPILNRLVIEGIASLICFIIVLFAAIKFDLSWFYYFISILSLIFGILFLVSQANLRVKQYNIIAYKNYHNR